ncbi:50S ribosomal protein L25/general stress protein Ctc [Albimonas sp. CAU 1670]|uniref:50S ribosomal protein L25/general stress protein Ctc n=1 Tax=Albimonas sp. CAU 1670 TaxID=3032599 RepID=UPI0023DC1A2A|nr:50S ribosomal protein L25/general stress protein Ctc [Albimonas sp. CAU 1670]MDF2232977.1 50S ribosomal protein L25/general stress protein Ctc [Albimonas sp. CAU 1670]
MAELPVLEATARSGTGKGAARAARREGLVPGVIYGGGQDPVTINVKHNELLKRLKAGRFLSTLFNVKVDGADNRVICRAVQRDVVRDLPTHVDFLRLTEKSRVNLFVHVDYVNQEASPGLKKGGVLTVVRSEVELNVVAGSIPDHITVDLTGKSFGDVIHISDVELPKGVTPVIKDRDFVLANISAPSGLRAAEAEEAEGEAEEAAAEE